MRRTLESILTYLSLLASIGSFVITALTFLPPSLCLDCRSPQGIERRESPATASRRQGPGAEQTVTPQRQPETAAPALAQKPSPDLWREKVIQLCALVIAVCLVGIMLMRLLRMERQQ
jgi:hypothetical protein